MIYKLNELAVDLRNGSVTCRCELTLQTVYTVEFKLPESSLYAVAAAAGRDSWENEDVVTVAKTELGISLTL